MPGRRRALFSRAAGCICAGGANNPGGACWQSSPGYVDDVGRTGRVSLVANGACHGALLAGGAVRSVRDQIAVLATPTAASPTPALNPATGLVSITAGANDVGVYQVLFECATSSTAACGAAPHSPARLCLPCAPG